MSCTCWLLQYSEVALRKESVDRNLHSRNGHNVNRESLSARRAWIEMPDSTHRREPFRVALRKESVDRNRVGSGCLKLLAMSLSARRAWIEISGITA